MVHNIYTVYLTEDGSVKTLARYTTYEEAQKHKEAAKNSLKLLKLKGDLLIVTEKVFGSYEDYAKHKGIEK